MIIPCKNCMSLPNCKSLVIQSMRMFNSEKIQAEDFFYAILFDAIVGKLGHKCTYLNNYFSSSFTITEEGINIIKDKKSEVLQEL